MKHRNHMILVAAVAFVAMIVLVPRGIRPFGAGVGFALLLCPLVMGTMMWMMMRRTDGPTQNPERSPAQLSDNHQPAAGGPQL
ncbi:MAG: hypothetical protein HY826_07610 [Actinobacteria bacterium]|nr:hypothetical protein [Actinomycetota bacterium]